MFRDCSANDNLCEQIGNNAYDSRKFQNYDNSKIITLIRISKKCRLN